VNNSRIAFLDRKFMFAPQRSRSIRSTVGAVYEGVSPPSAAPTALQNCIARRYIYATLKPSTVLDVRQFIDERPLSRYQGMVAALCAMIVFIDGFDAQVMGPVGPVLIAQLHITKAGFGPVSS